MNANTFFNRFEIFFYSALISAMSWISHFRTGSQVGSVHQRQPAPHGETGSIQQMDLSQPKSFALSWQSIKAALLPLLLWTVLGFAAGFLIGMLSPG
jgi:hypothetical protein